MSKVCLCLIIAKGQLISKCLFGVFNFFQKTNKNKTLSDLYELLKKVIILNRNPRLKDLYFLKFFACTILIIMYCLFLTRYSTTIVYKILWSRLLIHPRGVEGAHDFLRNSANTDLIRQAKGEPRQALVPPPTLETNKQTKCRN